MKRNALLKKINFSDVEFKKIEAAIQEGEKKTTGEIAVAITPESAHYSYWELLASNVFAAVVLLILLPFSSKISQLYNNLYWQNAPEWILPAFYVLCYLSAVVIFFYLTNIPAFDRLVIPSQVKKSCVSHRAMRHFAESGVYDTAEHSGVLIFVSYMEHQVRIIADSGISGKISQDLWNLIADELAENIKQKDVCGAFVNAIEKCSDLLAKYFPNKEENPNELPDGLVILEDSEWY